MDKIPYCIFRAKMNEKETKYYYPECELNKKPIEKVKPLNVVETLNITKCPYCGRKIEKEG